MAYTPEGKTIGDAAVLQKLSETGREGRLVERGEAGTGRPGDLERDENSVELGQG
jgi:hypothetical protein